MQSVSSKGKEAEGVSGLPEPEEAAADDAEGAPAVPSPAAPKDPFPLKDSIIIDLEALPQVCSVVSPDGYRDVSMPSCFARMQ